MQKTAYDELYLYNDSNKIHVSFDSYLNSAESDFLNYFGIYGKKILSIQPTGGSYVDVGLLFKLISVPNVDGKYTGDFKFQLYEFDSPSQSSLVHEEDVFIVINSLPLIKITVNDHLTVFSKEEFKPITINLSSDKDHDVIIRCTSDAVCKDKIVMINSEDTCSIFSEKGVLTLPYLKKLETLEWSLKLFQHDSIKDNVRFNSNSKNDASCKSFDLTVKHSSSD